MKEWFSNQSPRDQVALLLVAGFLLVFGLFQFALGPASEARGPNGGQQSGGERSAEPS